MPEAKQSGAEHIEAITRDLACPQCEYNLRGLLGDVVSCPECGTRVDVTKLVTMQWSKPWYKAPGLTRVYLPTTLGVVGVLIVPISAKLVSVAADTPMLLVFPVLAALAFLGWLALMWQAYRVFRGPEGLLLALLSHVILVAYLFGVGFALSGVLSGLSGVFSGLASGGDVLALAAGLVLTVVGFALLWAGRWGEKFVAARCIREYLRRRTGGA